MTQYKAVKDMTPEERKAYNAWRAAERRRLDEAERAQERLRRQQQQEAVEAEFEAHLKWAEGAPADIQATLNAISPEALRIVRLFAMVESGAARTHPGGMYTWPTVCPDAPEQVLALSGLSQAKFNRITDALLTIGLLAWDYSDNLDGIGNVHCARSHLPDPTTYNIRLGVLRHLDAEP